MKISELPKNSYVYRYKKIVFNGLPVPKTPQREKPNELDEWDMVFESKEKFNKWYKELTIKLAELDECMNFCKYFVRIKGNEGNYVRDGKSYPVNGTWCLTQDYGVEPYLSFEKWLKENNFYETKFELMDRYK